MDAGCMRRVVHGTESFDEAKGSEGTSSLSVPFRSIHLTNGRSLCLGSVDAYIKELG